MNDKLEIIDRLLLKPCYVIDVLPKRVPISSKGQFYEVEHYLLNNFEEYGLHNRYTGIILKLMCYYETSVYWDGNWLDTPAPERIADAVNKIMNHHFGTLDVLFAEDDALLVFEGGCLNMSVYNPSDHLKSIMASLAMSEGLFWWKSEA